MTNLILQKNDMLTKLLYPILIINYEQTKVIRINNALKTNKEEIQSHRNMMRYIGIRKENINKNIKANLNKL